MSDTANAATEVAEEVAEHATAIAQTSRGLSGHDVGLIFSSVLVGVGVGGVLGYIFASRKLETKYNQIAADDIAQMREHYQAKLVALDSQNGKGDLSSLVEEKGYISSAPSDRPPMAVDPPSSVVEAAQELSEEIEGTPGEPVVEIDTSDSAEAQNVFEDHKVEEWDDHKERAKRSPMIPYVIHKDELDDDGTYDSVTWTYYEGDDVLCNERDEVISQEDRDQQIGEANLEKFGHGSGDPNVVYIRNNQLEIDYEIVKSPNSYVKEVIGISDEQDMAHSHRSRRRERMSFDDD